MRPLLIIAVVSTSCCCSPVFAQVGMGTTMAPLSATSPLGSNPGTPIGGTGIPTGASSPSAPVVGSLPDYPTSASSTACSTLGTPPTAMYGSPSSYDGGGVTLNGISPPATASMAPGAPGMQTIISSGMSATSGLSSTSGMAVTAGFSGMCGSGATSVASSSTPTSASATPSARAGIPLDSTEIANRGVGAWAPVPAPSVAPITGTVGPTATLPTMPTVSSPSTASSTTTTSTVP
jgi:hypothetical protein